MSIIQAGTVLARAVTPLAEIVSSKKQSPGVKVTFQLKEGVDKDRTIDWEKYFSETAEKNVKIGEALHLMGYDGEDPKSVMLKDVVLVIEHEQYQKENGEFVMQAKISWVNDLDRSGRAVPANPVQAAGIKTRLQAALAAAKAKTAPAKPEDEPRF